MKLGKAFSDSLILESKVSKHVLPTPRGAWWSGYGRTLLFVSIFIIAMFILLIRLFHLTLIAGHKYRALADTNRTRELIRHAPRGLLLDRTGKPLVNNVLEYRLIHPCSGVSETSCITNLSKADGEDLRQKGMTGGSFLEIDYSRDYPFADALAHMVGYTGELTDTELTAEYYALRQYQRGDRIGRVGAEAVYEERLRGRDGRELVEVDSSNTILRTLGIDREMPGEDITLSVDAKLAEMTARVFPAGEKGAVVVTKPQTGEILALYSSPSFNPNKFASGLTQREYDTIVHDPDNALFNRSIGGVYPPGSTFKIVTSIAALEEGVITGNTSIEDVGVLKIGSLFSFPNWYFLQSGKTEGMLDVERALARSNDIFFYKAGEWVGITKLALWARKLGLGAPLGIEFGGEASGLVPDPSWKDLTFSTPGDLEARNNVWYIGDTYHMAIGQGYLLTTPLQVNTWTNVIANGGKLCRPTIEKVQSGKSKVERCKDLGLKRETIRLITEGMRQACTSGGTGWPLFNFKVQSSKFKVEDNESSRSAQTLGVSVPVACKTGTAEFGDPQNKTHAWFTVFAPLPVPLGRDSTGQAPSSPNQEVLTGNPEISITVLLEGAGQGSDVAAPIAKKILEEWFSR